MLIRDLCLFALALLLAVALLSIGDRKAVRDCDAHAAMPEVTGTGCAQH